MNIMQEILNNQDFMIAQRRHFHVNAESSARENQTLDHIASLLSEWNIPYDVVEQGGILGYIQGKETGRCVLLRADCDALRMMEFEENLKGQKPCVSANKGVCHACGHDGHMATLLTAAKVLNEHKDELNGKVILMFERGEEYTHNCVVLHKYLEDKQMHIDSCYGNHLYNALKSGEIALLDGPAMSGIATFGFTIFGRGGHGSRPDLSVSPIDCFVAIYNGINMLRMRNITPFHALTFSVGSLHSGTAHNVIPGELSFTGTVRDFYTKDGKAFLNKMVEVVEENCKLFGCTYRIDKMVGPAAAVLNDPDCAALARKAVGDAVGSEHLVSCEPWMASETFALTQAKWPGVFGLVGIANEEKGTGAAHHNGAFDLDEDALKYGAAAYVAYAQGFLASDLDTSDKVFKGSFAEIYEESGYPAAEIAYLKNEGPMPDFLNK